MRFARCQGSGRRRVESPGQWGISVGEQRRSCTRLIGERLAPCWRVCLTEPRWRTFVQPPVQGAPSPVPVMRKRLFGRFDSTESVQHVLGTPTSRPRPAISPSAPHWPARARHRSLIAVALVTAGAPDRPQHDWRHRPHGQRNDSTRGEGDRRSSGTRLRRLSRASSTPPLPSR